jgi:hypothetical protein
MNFNDQINLEDLNHLCNLTNFTNLKELETFINFVNKFDSYESFFKFMMIMKTIPTIGQIDNLTKSNINLGIFESLQSQGYFKLLCPIQKYHLFVSACSHDSIDIAMLIFNNNIDLEGVKELMLNYLAEVGGSIEYVIFRNIWEKNVINFDYDEIKEIFFSILKSSNLEFIEWFCSLNLINFNDNKIKEQIGYDIIGKAENHHDFVVAKFICSQFIKNK